MPIVTIDRRRDDTSEVGLLYAFNFEKFEYITYGAQIRAGRITVYVRANMSYVVVCDSYNEYNMPQPIKDEKIDCCLHRSFYANETNCKGYVDSYFVTEQIRAILDEARFRQGVIRAQRKFHCGLRRKIKQMQSEIDELKTLVHQLTPRLVSATSSEQPLTAEHTSSIVSVTTSTIDELEVDDTTFDSDGTFVVLDADDD